MIRILNSRRDHQHPDIQETPSETVQAAAVQVARANGVNQSNPADMYVNRAALFPSIKWNVDIVE
eukprot:8925567-Karenia_brevis.AAC.1